MLSTRERKVNMALTELERERHRASLGCSQTLGPRKAHAVLRMPPSATDSMRWLEGNHDTGVQYSCRNFDDVRVSPPRLGNFASLGVLSAI